MILIRFLLIGLIVYLIVRSFTKYSEVHGPVAGQDGQEKNGKPSSKKVSKEVGEYIDYEELRK
jgi:hypothetical protein